MELNYVRHLLEESREVFKTDTKGDLYYAYIFEGDKYGLDIDRGLVELGYNTPTLFTEAEAHYIVDNLKEDYPNLHVVVIDYKVNKSDSFLSKLGRLAVLFMIGFTVGRVVQMVVESYF